MVGAGRARSRLLFVGVTTSGSSIMELFPRWAEILGLDATIEGRDVALDADPAAHLAAVAEIRDDPTVAGALVTTHKVAVYRHAGALFDELDRYAHLCREVSCISKRGPRLIGHAKDPITAGLAMDDMLGPDYWRDRHADVLCLGAGGAGTAITVRLASSDARPRRIVVADKDPERLEVVRSICREMGAEAVEMSLVGSARDADRLLEELADGSLVVNATGMGKDIPGSPLTDRALFPRGAVAWDLNYRGDLRFLEQARAQPREREVRIHDGWRYFLHGWSQVTAEVFDLDLTPERFSALAEAAEPLRPPDHATTPRI